MTTKSYDLVVADTAERGDALAERWSAPVGKAGPSNQVPRRLRAQGTVPDAAFDKIGHSAGMKLLSPMIVTQTSRSGWEYAIADVGFSEGKPSWSFCLRADTYDEERSFFGAALTPVRVAHDSPLSPGNFIISSYGGSVSGGSVFFAGDASLSVHPGDTVRVDVDFDEGTVGFAINETKHPVVIDNLPAGCTVYPICGSSSAGVGIELIAVSHGRDEEEEF